MPLYVANRLSSVPLFSPYPLSVQPFWLPTLEISSRVKSPPFMADMAESVGTPFPPHSVPTHGHSVPTHDDSLNVTPQNKGTSAQPDYDEQHKVSQINRYLEEDINERVRIIISDFLALILDLSPNRFNEMTGKNGIIDQIKSKETFQNSWKKYLHALDQTDTIEKDLYPLLVDVVNAAFDVVYGKDKPFFFDGSGRTVKGSYAERKPDLSSLLPGYSFPTDPETSKRVRLYWPMITWWIEVKNRKGESLDGRPLINKEMSSNQDTTGGGHDHKDRLSETDMLETAVQKLEHARDTHITPPRSTGPRKRTRSDICAHEESADVATGQENHDVDDREEAKIDSGDAEREPKRPRTEIDTEAVISTALLLKEPALGSEMNPAAEAKLKPHDLQRHTLLQCAGYGLEMLSSGLLRSHAVSAIIDSSRFQVAYYDRSKIVLSKVVDLETNSGQNFFLAVILQLAALSGSKSGLIPVTTARNHSSIIQPPLNDEYLVELQSRINGEKRKTRIGDKCGAFPGSYVFSGCELKLANGKTLKLEETLHRAHSIIGRGSTVIKALLEGKKVAVKLSFPGARREAEHDLIKRAQSQAKDEHLWAKNHLPTVLWSETYSPDKDVPETRLECFLTPLGVRYEKRVLRIIVQEILHPITDLTDSQEVAQVLFDILQIHRWLVDHGRILHRDISLANIMYRRIDDRVYRVLNDYDLASTLPLDSAQRPTSELRTGTIPYMSWDLLDIDSNKSCQAGPAYYHDLEALFYVIVILCNHYEKKTNSARLDKVPANDRLYNDWFSPNHQQVAGAKTLFVTQSNALFKATGFFDGFTELVDRLRKQLRNGHKRKNEYLDGDLRVFDWSTLGGHVTYEVFKEAMLSCLEFPSELLVRYKAHLELGKDDFNKP
ncbi:hypothetical protein K435DRAFT_806358 [Dendrothele bispora CBS 962.96]|uniref:Fungal-type protein kinase domain-containing protein n=1 Tax=Dendrothele bispora (strain CBS 962.96) TaxID=1314807 RepID=A0A4S8L855_DENBC|nr:hypothetical protein K435DRAFT_806358 [Dendrothele bispora CBS 962.96]